MVLSMVLNSVRLKYTITFPLCVFKFLSFMHWTVSYECLESPKMNTSVLFMYFWPGKLGSVFFVMLYFHQIFFFQSIFISLVADSQDGRLEEQREKKRAREWCLFFLALFLLPWQIRSSMLRYFTLWQVCQCCHFFSNTIRLHSHSLYLFIFSFLTSFFLLLKVTCKSHWQQLLYLCLVFRYIF